MTSIHIPGTSPPPHPPASPMGITPGLQQSITCRHAHLMQCCRASVAWCDMVTSWRCAFALLITWIRSCVDPEQRHTAAMAWHGMARHGAMALAGCLVACRCSVAVLASQWHLSGISVALVASWCYALMLLGLTGFTKPGVPAIKVTVTSLVFHA